MTKIESYQELKNNILRSLQVESRVAMRITTGNYHKKDKTPIPLNVQKDIDKVYVILSEIALKYRVSTQKVGKLIEDARKETKDVVGKEYKGKVEEQYTKVGVLLRQMETELNEIGKIDEIKNSLKLEQAMSSKRNGEIREETVKNLNRKVNEIREEMTQTFHERFLDPRKFKEMQEEIESSLVNLKTGDKIEEALLEEDKFTTQRIIRDLRKICK